MPDLEQKRRKNTGDKGCNDDVRTVVALPDTSVANREAITLLQCVMLDNKPVDRYVCRQGEVIKLNPFIPAYIWSLEPYPNS